MNYLSCAANLDRLVEQFQERYPNLNPIGGTYRNVIKDYMEGIMQWFWDDDEVDDICNDLAKSGWFEESRSQMTLADLMRAQSMLSSIASPTEYPRAPIDADD